MSRTIRYYAPLVVTSGASTVTNAVVGFDDAVTVQVFISSAVSGGFFNVQVAPRVSSGQFPEAYQLNLPSTTFYSLQTIYTTSAANLFSVLAGQTAILPLGGGVAFQQIRLLGTGAETTGTTVGWVTAQIDV